MGVTIIGRLNLPTPVPTPAPILRFKRNWSDNFIHLPAFELVRARASVSGQGLGSCEFRRKFGNVKRQWESEFSSKRVNYSRQGGWVELQFVGPHGAEPAWIGRISTERRRVHSVPRSIPPKPGDPVPSGEQIWIAHEPLQELRKIHVYRSFWLVEDQKVEGQDPTFTERDLGLLTGMNDRDETGALVGNRTSIRWWNGVPDEDGIYLFGGTDLWTHYDFLEYLLARFVDQGATNGPQWSIGGQADLLKSLSTTITFGDSATVAQMIRRLIPTSMGIDFTIVPVPTSPSPGFEVFVYALNAKERRFNDFTMPLNPNKVVINPSLTPEAITVDVVETLDQQHDRINVIGAPIVVCCTLDAADGDLVPKWTDDLETKYKAGTGTAADDPDEHDAARRLDEYRAVYQHYGAPPLWDHLGGNAAPGLGADGFFNGVDADFQHTERRTLSWLPLREGIDYGDKSFPAGIDGNPDGHQPPLLPPAAWVYDEEKERFVPAEDVGIALSVLPTDWGVMLHASPNHLLALDDFSGAAGTDIDPLYDPAKIVTTVAFRSDQRLRLHYELVSGAHQVGHTFNVVVPDAELWYVAPGTVVGVDKDGKLKTTTKALFPRDDSNRLSMIMAGAIARYYDQRARATITIKGLWPWPFLLGSILTVIQAGTNTQFIQSPITSIEWDAGTGPNPRPTTVIRTGFAI